MAAICSGRDELVESSSGSWKLGDNFEVDASRNPSPANGPDAASHTPHEGLCKGKAVVTSSIRPSK